MPVGTPPIYTCGSGDSNASSFGAGGSGGGLDRPWLSKGRLRDGSGLPWYRPSATNGGFAAGLNELTAYSENTYNVAPSVSLTAAPVRYFNGTMRMDSTDLSSDAFGMPWGQTRSWTNGANYVAATPNGNGTIIVQQPHLVVGGNGAALALVTNGTNARFWHRSWVIGGDASYWTPWVEDYGTDKLSSNTTTNEISIMDPGGNTLTLNDFNPSVPTNQQGQFKRFADRSGNVVSVMGYDLSGRITEFQRSGTTSGVTVTESWLYTYLGGGTGQLRA